MDDELGGFLRQGILREHRRALSLIDVFLSELGNLLRNVLAARSTIQGGWGVFTPTVAAQASLGTAKKYANAYIDGLIGARPCRIQLWVHWEWPGPNARLIVEVEELGTNGRKIPLRAPATPTVVEPGNDGHLFIEPAEDLDIRRDLTRLLDAVVAALQ